jgi:hypothetical protein
MAKAAPRTTNELRGLHRDLTRRAERCGVPAGDAEDVAASAIAKASAEEQRPDAPGLEVRASVALRDEIPEFFRRRKARPKLMELTETDEEKELEAQTKVGSGLELAEAIARIREELGDEALEYAFLVSAGHTEADIAARPGWDRPRAGRVRKRIERQAIVQLADLRPIKTQKEES